MVEKMDFQSLNRWNVVMNNFSGNFLPVTCEKSQFSLLRTAYAIFVYLIQISHIIACISGVFFVSTEKALQDSTINFVVIFEVVVMFIHSYRKKNLLRGLIKKLNDLFAIKSELLNNIVTTTVKPYVKPLKIYTIGLTACVVVWASTALTEIFNKNDFYYGDYRMPSKFGREPYPLKVFIVGVLYQMFCVMYLVAKKTSFDAYAIHLILLLTAQYKFVAMRLASILENVKGADADQKMFSNNKVINQKELRSVIQHHIAVVETSIILKDILAVNVGLLYITNAFRLCFVGFMFVTNLTDFFATSLSTAYGFGVAIQLYIICQSVQNLYDASLKVTDDAFHECWYACDVPVQKVLLLMMFTKKLDCKLSAVGDIDLTLPSFMAILNQAYSICLLLLRFK